jgi:hypothetical protein
VAQINLLIGTASMDFFLNMRFATFTTFTTFTTFIQFTENWSKYLRLMVTWDHRLSLGVFIRRSPTFTFENNTGHSRRMNFSRHPPLFSLAFAVIIANSFVQGTALINTNSFVQGPAVINTPLANIFVIGTRGGKSLGITDSIQPIPADMRLLFSIGMPNFLLPNLDSVNHCTSKEISMEIKRYLLLQWLTESRFGKRK